MPGDLAGATGPGDGEPGDPRSTPGRRVSGADALAVATAEPSDTLIALDFDGTLAPIVDRPEDAVAHPDAAHVLTALAGAGYRIGIITGRPVRDVLRLGTGFEAIPGLTIYGHYGMERWSGGAVTAPRNHLGVTPARAALEDLAAGEPGVRVEDKGHAVALHTRTAPDPSGALGRLTPAAQRIAASHGLEAVPGRFVVELRPPGTDKGGALRDLVAASGVRAVVFAGDDLGDLPAVQAVRQLDVTGLVICSDSPETPPELRAAADLVVDGPDGVLAVLRRLVA